MSERVFKPMSYVGNETVGRELPTVEELLHRILAKYDDIPIRHLMAKDVDIIRHATLALEILEKDK